MLAGILALTVLGAARTVPKPEAPRWVRVEYDGLVEGRRLTHSGEPVGVLLQRLGDREDALAYRLLDPLLEPFAFVLIDALDSMSPAPDPPMVEVGSLWEPGEAQPAWVELVRARRFVLESDGQGKLRAILPAASTEDPVEAAKEAWGDAWPVLRHALAGERRRLAHRRGGDLPALDVEVHAYRHLLAKSIFELGVAAWRTTVSDTRPTGERPPLELGKLQSILDRGLRIEGARLEPSGRVRWFTSEAETKSSILGRSLTLADLAVAYRAVARGGYGEPYMSLDRAPAPHLAIVNYGGRLRDTSLGMVSLLADVRFKTFSVGIDLLGDGDVRDAVRRAVPGFQTHLERFASDPTAGAVMNQQTRFWFYPDDVDLTLSAEGDVLAFRKVRMTAASERVREAGTSSTEPAWTKDTVSFLNAHYDALVGRFPELSDLDESVRLLSLFTWLEAARSRGLKVPELDALLALELPALPTPRRFPQLLTHDVLPAPGAAGIVDALDRTEVGDALERLETRFAEALPAPKRLLRDRLMLNPQVPDQAALIAEIEHAPAGASPYDQDLLSYRAERLLMHARVLATISPERRAVIEGRRKLQPATRVFSVGIGGVDLGMSAVLARSAGRASRLGLAAGGNAAPKAADRSAPGPVTLADPVELPMTEWPDHGLGSSSARATTTLAEEEGTILARRLAGTLVRQGTFKAQGAAAISWDEVLAGMEGPELRTRRRIADPAAKTPVFERVEEGRFLRYTLDRTGDALRAQPSTGGLPPRALGVGAPAVASALTVPSELTVMDLQPADPADPAGVRLRLSDAGGRERGASVPRSLLQRLVRGREIDLTPDRPLQAFTPPAAMLGTSKALMVLQSTDQSRPPWSGPSTPLPGEEDAVRIAGALTRWWSTDPSSAVHAVVGTSAIASPARWAKTPRLDGTPSVVVVVTSDEPPGVLGKRLRQLATDPALSGKILAVAALSGALRPDLPASLLAEGKIAALGVYEVGPVGRARALSELAAFERAVSADGSKGRRVEEVPGPFTWYY